MRIKDLLMLKPAFDRVFNTPMRDGISSRLASVGEVLFDALNEYNAANRDMTDKFNEESGQIIKREREKKQAEGLTTEAIEKDLQDLGKARRSVYDALVRELMDVEVNYVHQPLPWWRRLGLRVSPLDLMAMKQLGIFK